LLHNLHSSPTRRSSDLEVRVGRRGSQRLRPNPGLGQEPADPFGISGQERQRLNCNDFSDFARISNWLFQRSICLSVNLSSLLWADRKSTRLNSSHVSIS